MTATLQRRLRQPVTDAAFARFVADASADVREIVKSLASGKISVPEWGGVMLDALAEAHAQAAFLGRQRAGDLAPFDRDDQRFGQLVAQEEWPFLQGFERDLMAGRYTSAEGGLDVAAVGRRANLYVARTWGTANEALALTADEPIWWRLGDADHCRSCVALADGSPYRPGALPTVPRGGKTECLVSCACSLVTASGLRGFAP